MAPTNRRSTSNSGSGTSTQKAQIKDKDRPRNQWVFLANNEVVEEDKNINPDCQPCIAKLRHPRTETGVCFVFSSSGTVFELQCFDEKYHSWFIGSCIQSGGQLYITNQMDPLYFVLPYLINAGKKERFMSLDQIVCDEEFPACDKILECLKKEQLVLIADLKECGDDDCFYRYNKSKTMRWLKSKVENVADTLAAKNIDVSVKGAHSAIFVQSKTAKATRESYTRYAAGLISDYIPLEVEEALKEHLGLDQESEEQPPSKTEVSDEEPPSKKAKISTEVAPLEDYSTDVDLKAKTQNVKLTAAQKRLSKVDKTGMKSISSFFAKK